MKTKVTKLTVRVPTEQYARIREAASGLGVSVNAYVISCALADLDDRDAAERNTALLVDHADAMEAAMDALAERLQSTHAKHTEQVKSWLQKIIAWQESHAPRAAGGATKRMADDNA